MKLIGHAAVFNSRSVDLGGFVEVIRPGAFARTLREGEQFAVHHHDFAQLLGSTRAGSLQLSEDARGLAFTLELPDTSLGRDTHALVQRGDLASMSFSFFVNGAQGEAWRELSSELFERTLLDVTLIEISTTAIPAYPAASVSARALMDAAAARSTRNRMLRKALSSRLQTHTRHVAARVVAA